MLALALPIGLLIGLSLGALGGGGSILTVPALVYLLGQDTRTATTSSLIIVGITALSGMIAHHREGRVRVVQGVTFGVLGIAGSYVGSRLSVKVAPDVLLAAFSILMLVVAAAMLARSRRGTTPPAPPGRGSTVRGGVTPHLFDDRLSGEHMAAIDYHAVQQAELQISQLAHLLIRQRDGVPFRVDAQMRVVQIGH